MSRIAAVRRRRERKAATTSSHAAAAPAWAGQRRAAAAPGVRPVGVNPGTCERQHRRQAQKAQKAEASRHGHRGLLALNGRADPARGRKSIFPSLSLHPSVAS